MANLTATLPASIAPVTFGGVTLSEAEQGTIWAVMPYRGQNSALSKAMKKAHGVAFPGPNEMTQKGDVRAAFSRLDQAFVFGAVPDTALATHAALTDQSDAWTHLILEGDGVADVLARLTPLDLSSDSFPVPAAKRSSLGHMATFLLRTGEARFEILVFRSMAKTALHEIKRAMKAVAARQEIT